jgi:hypothetical protein
LKVEGTSHDVFIKAVCSAHSRATGKPERPSPGACGPRPREEWNLQKSLQSETAVGTATLQILDTLGGAYGIGVFLLMTVFIGGGAAWLTGRAVAATWRPCWHVAVYAMILGCVVRFLRFALFEDPLLSPLGYLADAVTCMLFGLAGFRVTRVTQMVTDYGWINERSGLLNWRRRTNARTIEPESR